MPQDTIFLSIPKDMEEPAGGKSHSASECINIVLATDATYFYPMLCVVKSVCANKRKGTKYQFVLLVDSAFTSDRRRQVNDLLKGYGLPEAKILNRDSEYRDVVYKADHLSRASCYRLQIPSLLPKMDKCIYLDCDILVRGDLSQFYDMLEGDDLIVAVMAAAYQQYEGSAKARAELLGLPDISTYTNSGVMVMNLKLMREISIEDTFNEMLTRDFPDIDQDILNAACYGRVRLAPPIYNAMTKYSFKDDSYDTDVALSKCWSREEWDAARTDPVIVHFADTDKPWTDYALPFAKEWWGYIDDMSLTKQVFDFFYDMHASRQESVYEMRMLLNKRSRDVEDTRRALMAEKAEVQAQLDAANERIGNLRGRIKVKNERISRQKERIEVLKKRLISQRGKTVSARRSLKNTRARLAKVKGSKSYKIGRAITKPYRSLKGNRDR